jgi:hypothetical protein
MITPVRACLASGFPTNIICRSLLVLVASVVAMVGLSAIRRRIVVRARRNDERTASDVTPSFAAMSSGV